MRTHSDWDEARGETLLLIPLVVVVFGLLVYCLVELLPRVKGLPG
jgi:hypothetical protein